MLKQNLQEELKQAMLGKKDLEKSVLRLLLSAIGYYEIQKGGAGYSASDEDVLLVIEKQAKQRRESIEQFTTAGRKDLADKEAKELEILQTYLPRQLNNEEIQILVDEAVKQTGATTMQDIGKVMGALMPKTKGKADGAVVSKLVKEALSTS